MRFLLTLAITVQAAPGVVAPLIFAHGKALIPFQDENDAVLQGSDTIYGLGAGIWTCDISRAITVARKLRAGMVWINGYYRGNLGSPFLAATSSREWAVRAASIPFRATPRLRR